MRHLIKYWKKKLIHIDVISLFLNILLLEISNFLESVDTYIIP